MRSTLRTVAATAILAAVAVPTAQAQVGTSHVGPRVGYNFDAEAVTIGGQFSIPIARRLEFYPSADVHLVDVGSMLTVNIDLKYRVPAEGIQWLYLGTGLGIARRSFNDNSDSDLGLNLFAGVESLSGRIHPFGEIRFLVADGSQAQLAAGLNFTL
jgi:hypothetical protein